MEHRFGFTGSSEPKPKEDLVTLIEVDESVWNLNPEGGYVICRRKDEGKATMIVTFKF